MKLFLSIFISSILSIFIFNNAKSAQEDFNLCPLCTDNGNIICPGGFEPACADENPGETEPKCVFLETKYMPGCWKFIGIKKLDFNLDSLMLSPTSMVEIIGGGETYTLNREIIGCKKL